MSNKSLNKFVADYAKLTSGDTHRKMLTVGLMSALVWAVGTAGVFSSIALNNSVQYKTPFKTELKNTLNQHKNCIWIVACALLLLAVGIKETDSAISRHQARGIAKHIIKRTCGNMSSRDLQCFANLTLENMSDIQRKEILDAGIALRAEIDKYDAQWMNMQITFVQKQRLVSAAMIKYTNDVAKMIENNEVVELLNSIKNNMNNDTFVVRNGQFIAKQK